MAATLAADGTEATYTDLLVALAAAALRAHPRANSSWDGSTVVGHGEVNISLAVAVPDGLLTPVIRRADTLPVAEIAARRRDLVDRARARRLTPDDLAGGTFTVSNLGMFGVDAFHAVLNPPQAAILAVGRIAEEVVARGGRPVVRPVMAITLSCDHRVLDGATAARLLDTVASLIEEPLRVMT